MNDPRFPIQTRSSDALYRAAALLREVLDCADCLDGEPCCPEHRLGGDNALVAGTHDSILFEYPVASDEVDEHIRAVMEKKLAGVPDLSGVQFTAEAKLPSSRAERPMKPTIPEVVDRFRTYHEAHPAWGALHIVLEDGNVADCYVFYCAERAEEVGDEEGAALARILLQMSKTQRRKLAHVA